MMRKISAILLISAAYHYNPAALAEESDESSSEEVVEVLEPVVPQPQVRVEKKHYIQHDIQHEMLKPKEPMYYALQTGLWGTAIGLGLGSAGMLINYSASGEFGKADRIGAASVGGGFVVGAIYGFFAAHYHNRDIRERERKLLGKNIDISIAPNGLQLAYSF